MSELELFKRTLKPFEAFCIGRTRENAVLSLIQSFDNARNQIQASYGESEEEQRYKEILQHAFKDGPMNIKLWNEIETWIAFLQYISSSHYKNHLLLSEDISDYETRVKCVAGLFCDATSLLWHNMGGIYSMYKKDQENIKNKEILGKTLAEILQENLEKYKPSVLVTFGWPREAGLWERKPDENLINVLVGQTPVLRVVLDYQRGKGSDRTMLIALKNRIPNHFGIAISKNEKYNISSFQMAMEPLHSEDQDVRWVIYPEEKNCISLEIGLILSHLLNVCGTSEGYILR